MECIESTYNGGETMNYWLMKSEPDAYSIDDLEKNTVTQWEGIRNYQARNFMRDTMRMGDRMLFYHSNATPPGIVGTGIICKESYPDHFSWDPTSKYFDLKSGPNNPRWFMVDVKFESKFDTFISLETLKLDPKLETMMVIKKGMRLSIQPVDKAHFDHILELGLTKK